MKQTFDWDKLGVNRQEAMATCLISWGYYIPEIVLLFGQTTTPRVMVLAMAKGTHTRHR